MIKHITALLITLVFISCVSKEEARLNEIKVIGSHNSYKIAFEPSLFALLSNVDSARLARLYYDHPSITKQLDLGLRNLEIDLFHDPKGGRFSKPKALNWMKKKGVNPQPFDEDKKLEQPGFKVFHIQDIDFRSHQLLFSDLLKELKQWSKRNPNHIPVFITLEAKDKNLDSLTAPLTFTSGALDSIDREIVRHLGEDKLITPDFVRNGAISINEQVRKGGWPTLVECRGRFLFVLDDHGKKRDLYIKGYEGLKGRMMFADAEQGTPEAAFMIKNDPGKQGEEIKLLTEMGYMIRTRADAATREARDNDYTKFEAAKASGAQVITTDYYVPTQLFPSTYQVAFREGEYVEIPDIP